MRERSPIIRSDEDEQYLQMVVEPSDASSSIVKHPPNGACSMTTQIWLELGCVEFSMGIFSLSEDGVNLPHAPNGLVWKSGGVSTCDELENLEKIDHSSEEATFETLQVRIGIDVRPGIGYFLGMVRKVPVEIHWL
jgi:hypothetical protein